MSCMPQRSTYHHGDLRAGLVRVALELVAERGVGALSVAEAARRLGVSSGAPYRHFPTRSALLAATATAAARELRERLRTAGLLPAPEGSTPDGVETSSTGAAVYARFTAELGAGFDLIYSADLQGGDDAELLEAGRAVIDHLLPAVLDVTGGDAPAALELLERQIAAAHGYALLLRSGFMARRNATVDDIADHAAAIARTLAVDARAER